MMYSDNLEWSNEWAEKALEYVKSPSHVQGDMDIKGEGSFPRGETLTEKILAVLEDDFVKNVGKLEDFPAGTVYGCNGTIKTNEEEDIVSAVCLYKKP
nr:unnamed protein product [Haemonchus contortus]